MKKLFIVFVLLLLMCFCASGVFAETLSSVLGKVCIIRSAMNNNYVIDVYYRGTGNGTNVQLYQANDTPAQTFIISSVGGGYYKIVNTYSNKAIDVSGGIAGNEVNVQVWDQNGTDAQKFKFESAGSGYYYIKSKLGYYLDVYGAKCEDWTNIQTYQKNGGNNQKWLLTTSANQDDAIFTTKDVILGDFSTVEEWRKRMREAEGSVTGLSGFVTMHEIQGDVARTVKVPNGKMIVRANVLSYKIIKVQDPKTSGPLYEIGNKSSIRYINLRLPKKVRFTLHEHKFKTGFVWFDLQSLHYSTECSCGLKFVNRWDVPWPDDLPNYSAAGITVRPLYSDMSK